jgi:regulator of cell morphogenesis and NO signaling
MKLFSSDEKMADAIHRNYLLIPVINRFGIRLGFGDKSIRTVCAEHSIDSEFFLTIINTYSNENYFPELKLQTFNFVSIIQYLRKTHHYYAEVQLPLIESILKQMIEQRKEPSNKLQIVSNFYNEFKTELLSHLRHEENVTFPYYEKLYQNWQLIQNTQGLIPSQTGKTMKVEDKEHHLLDEKLFDLKNILIKYLPTADVSDFHCNSVISELFRLERDMKDHNRIEEKVLEPMAADIERFLKTAKKESRV